jgi:aminopeptidase N
MFTQMLKEGLAKKNELLKQNPQKAKSIDKQIAVLNKIIETFK